MPHKNAHKHNFSIEFHRMCVCVCEQLDEQSTEHAQLTVKHFQSKKSE